ncbi:MAG TPA: hypothetical protein VK164_10270 [Flavobacterium sp.]|uniref:hypothetical protein n=1 Tax=Flavobacterium sp. TaxID=239 RepID=UPI002B4B829D|nr:hypothetical protein [Flavobacterium sp.]HLO74309.1 hypothetical protein [Flavobacterium sp.]
MKKTILTFFLLTSITSFSQEVTEERFLFEKKLNLATKNDSISKHIKIIEEISIPADIDSISTDSKWELLYLHQTGWQESMPNNPHNINNLYIGKRNNIVTGKDLKDFFQTIGQKEILFNQIPSELSYMNRGAPLNGKFTIIFLKNNHITLQYIHSYPNGNQSSWFRKTNYYLKRIN